MQKMHEDEGARMSGGAGGFLEEFGGDGAMRRGIRVSADDTICEQ